MKTLYMQLDHIFYYIYFVYIIFFSKGVRSDPELRGVIPNSFDHIFKHIARTHDQQYLVRASYLEIYQVLNSMSITILLCFHS